VFELCVWVAEMRKFSGRHPVAADARVTRVVHQGCRHGSEIHADQHRTAAAVIDDDDAGEQRVANRIGGDRQVARLRRDLHPGGAGTQVADCGVPALDDSAEARHQCDCANRCADHAASRSHDVLSSGCRLHRNLQQ
jgi:hypothetical protein